jgi:hypothetical protein
MRMRSALSFSLLGMDMSLPLRTDVACNVANVADVADVADVAVAAVGKLEVPRRC